MRAADWYRARGKRTFDICGALIGLVLTLPLQVCIGACVLIRHGRPVLFRQARPGFNGELFEILKFRTMRNATGELRTDEDRLSPFGNRLRSTSLDELPSLWNVLRGDMSFVGPRPLLPRYLPLYNAEQSRRHDVRPGITGLAQVSGRNSLDWTERLAMDVEYVDRYSPGGDLRIMGETLRAVLGRRGVSADNHVTMPEFQGGGAGAHDDDSNARGRLPTREEKQP